MVCVLPIERSSDMTVTEDQQVEVPLVPDARKVVEQLVEAGLLDDVMAKVDGVDAGSPVTAASCPR